MALNLNKLFVRVPGDVTVADISAVSVQNDNQKKLYFLENLHQIVNNGIAYGVDPNTVQSITDLQQLIGKSAKDQNENTIIERLSALEAITVLDPSYVSIEPSANADGTNTPVINLNIVDITSDDNGLVDNKNAKGYIDAKANEAKTVVAAGEGIEVDTSTAASDGHTIYTIDSSLTLQYNAASGNNPATITLTGANGGVFGTVNVSDIVGNGVIDHTQYYPATGELVLSFKTAAGSTQDVSVDLTDILDLGDLMVKADSTDYLEITQVSGGTGDENQLSFAIKTVDVSTATASATGLADAFKVKEYVDSQTTDLAVTAEGDNYVSASVNAATDKKHVIVETNVEDLTVTGGTAATYGSDFIPTGNATHGTLSGEEGALADASDIATAVKTYVDGEIAIESARTDASLNYRISILDADVSTKGTNVSVGVTEVDGVITAVNVTEDYANISYVAATDIWTNDNSTGLVTGQDIETLKSYVDDKVSDSSMDAQGDEYITASIDAGNNKKINITADVQPLVVTTVAGTDTILTGVENSLADSSNIATSVTSFVNTRIAEEVAKLDATANVADTSSYINVSIGEVDGLLNSAASSIDVTYGSFTEATPTDGIATREGVQDFVDTYDFWETYSASNNG